MFTTYSYNQVVPAGEDGVCRVKQFMPLSGDPSNRKILIDEEEDIGRGVTQKHFDKKLLRKREREYAFQNNPCARLISITRHR